MNYVLVPGDKAANNVIVVRRLYYTKTKSNRSPYIFTLVQKVKHRLYKFHAFLNEAILS